MFNRINHVGIFSLLMLAGLLIGLLTFFDSGLKGITLLFLGTILGIVFLFFQYGFASGWRDLIENKNSTMISQHFLLAALCSIFFIPLIDLNTSIIGNVAPVSLSLFIGAFIFGFGMQLANGCGSGVLFTFGSGSGRMMVALPFFIIGSVIGTIILPYVLDVLSIGQIIIAKDYNTILRTIINFLLLISVFAYFFYYARKKNYKQKLKTIYGTITITILCVFVLFISDFYFENTRCFQHALDGPLNLQRTTGLSSGVVVASP